MSGEEGQREANLEIGPPKVPMGATDTELGLGQTAYRSLLPP